MPTAEYSFRIPATRTVRLVAILLSQPNHVGAGRLLQGKLVIRDRLIKLQLQDVQCDVILLLRALDLDLCRELDALVILVLAIPDIGRQFSILVVDKLPMRLQVDAAEDNLPR